MHGVRNSQIQQGRSCCPKYSLCERKLKEMYALSSILLLVAMGLISVTKGEYTLGIVEARIKGFIAAILLHCAVFQHIMCRWKFSHKLMLFVTNTNFGA